MTDLDAPARFDPTRYWEERLSTQCTLGATGWSSLGEAFNRWSYAVRRVVFTRFARRYLTGTSAPRVLDVGSGTGFYLDLWRKLGAREIVGCDLTSAAVERLKLRFPSLEIEQLDIGDARVELPAESYDAISVMDVLYHIVDDQRYLQALKNLAGMLKPHGTLILSENLVSQEQRGEHQVSRTSRQIERMLAEAGLTPVRTRPMFFLMNTPVASPSRLLHKWWNLACRLMRRHEAIGWILGAAVFPVEIALCEVLHDGPSTKIVACRRA